MQKEQIKSKMNQAQLKAELQGEKAKDKLCEAGRDLKHGAKQAADTVKDKSYEAKHKLDDVGRDLKHRGEHAKDKLKEAGHNIKEAATPEKSFTDSVKESLQSGVDTVKATAQAAKEKLEEAFQ